VRGALFEFRDFLTDDLLPKTSESQDMSISKTKALRTELGVEDLAAAREITKDA
jgi:hypothetical protein